MREIQPKIKRNHVYWTPDDIAALERAQSFADLSKIAREVLSRMPKTVGQVCGPISSGGLGSIEANLARFDQTIEQLIQEGKHIFDQIPFESYIFRLIKNGQGTRDKDQLLKEFYLPLLESGKIGTMYFMRGWEKSTGARWEHEQAERLGIKIVYL